MRFVFFLLGLWGCVTFAGCERIPEWELKSTRRDTNNQLAGYEQLQNWLWTCRGRQVSYRLGSIESLAGKSVEEFFDQFRVAALSPVEISGDKVILGTALLMDQKGYLVTQFHWVDQVEDIECRNLNIPWIKASSVGTDRPLNLAVLHVELGDKASWFRGDRKWLVRKEAFQVGDRFKVLSSTYPGMLDQLDVQLQINRPVLHTGIDENLILFLPTVPDVMQGGILVDGDLHLIGIHLAGRSSGWGTAIDMELLDTVVSSIVEKKTVERPYLGLRVRFVAEKGFRVSEVQVGGPAYRAGIRVDDIITKWNDKKLTRLDLWPELEMKDIGQNIKIVYQRNASEIEAQLEISSVR